MKRIFSSLLCLPLLFILLLPSCASAASTGWHTVQSTSPNGYCYLYSKASDRDGVSVNMGRYTNGSYVYVVDYYGGQDGKYNYCFVITQDGKAGYIHDYSLTPSLPPRGWQIDGDGWYTVLSTDPNGYCYLYSKPSDRDGVSVNMGRYDNGTSVFVLEYYGGQEGKYNYCLVQTLDGKTGYMHDYALTKVIPGLVSSVTSSGSSQPASNWYVVSSSRPNGYCYLYSAASDRDGVSVNLGKLVNGTAVQVLEYYGGQDGSYNYCYVRTQDGKYGFIHDYALVKADW